MQFENSTAQDIAQQIVDEEQQAMAENAVKKNLVLDNSGVTEIRVPGIGVELEHEEGERFAHGANDWVMEQRLTVRELGMIQMMDVLMDKPEWYRKVFDENIVDKWRGENANLGGGISLSEAAFEWCIKELRDKAKFYEEHKYAISLDTASRVAKSFELVGEDIRQELIANIQPLLDGKKDWHPGSDEQVLDLVHPSLYPLVYGRTGVMKTGQVGLLNAVEFCGQGDVVPRIERPPPEDPNTIRYRYGTDRDRKDRWSNQFQWLPCEVKFKEDQGTDVEITSYINNLHPVRFQGLYRAIEKMISLSVKPWNDVLVKRDMPRTPLRIRTYGADFDVPDAPEWIQKLPWLGKGEDDKEAFQKVSEYMELESNASEDSGEQGEWASEFPDPEAAWVDEMGLRGIAEWKYKRLRNLVHPEPGVAYSYDDWVQGKLNGAVVGGRYNLDKTHEYYDIKLQDDFRQNGLQVIVKLASIELTPEKPKYPGGSWHIEGMLNEHIVATAIYYYDVENISGPGISFRQEAGMEDEDMIYEQDEHEPLCEIFGVNRLRDEAAVQEIDTVSTPNGRFLAFPNTLQHCVHQFELEDKSKPGHRRFLVLWLVDPNYRIASTRNVPPQQYEWLEEDSPQLNRVKERLPPELTGMVFKEFSKDMMNFEQAKEYREDLMKERTANVERIERNFEEYNFCEH